MACLWAVLIVVIEDTVRIDPVPELKHLEERGRISCVMGEVAYRRVARTAGRMLTMAQVGGGGGGRFRAFDCSQVC